MIRAIRPSAMAQDDATLVTGWNVAPNVAYILRLLPGTSSCGVFLFAEGGTTLIASGAALTGTDQPCMLIPQAGQAVGMIDADLGWHLLLTTTGTESQREIRIGPAVDLPDEIHPVYGSDDLAVVRATAAIDAAAHYIDDVTVTCPLGLSAGLGSVVSVPVDGAAVAGQVESVTWTATPGGTSEQAVIRRHVAIAPEVFVEPVLPVVADDAGTATHLTGASGNVLANDASGLTVVAVNGLSGNIGTAVDGDNGGLFTINASGSWTFDPDGDFAMLSGSETANTSIAYHASDGTAEAMATLTVTVSRASATPVAVNDTGETRANATTSGNVLNNDTDADGDVLTVSRVNGSVGNVGGAVAGSNGGVFTIASTGAWTFDPDGDFVALVGSDTAETSVTYHASDGTAEAMGALTVIVSAPLELIPLEVVAHSTGQITNGPFASFSITAPNGIASGDLLLVVNGHHEQGPRSSAALDAGVITSGYTEHVDVFVSNSSRCTELSLSSNFVGDPPVSTITVAGNTSSFFTAASIAIAIRGVDPTNVFDVTPTVSTHTTSKRPDPPAISPVTDGTLLIMIVASPQGTASALSSFGDPQPPSGWDLLTSFLTRNTNNNFHIGVATKTWNLGDGTIDPDVWTGYEQPAHTSFSSASIMLAIPPR